MRNIQLLQEAQVCAICEPNPTMQQRSLQLAPDARLVEQIEKMPFAELDALIIASPNYLRVNHLCRIAALTQLPLLVEKPLATNEDDIRFVRQFEHDYTAPIWVAMEYRYMPPIA